MTRLAALLFSVLILAGSAFAGPGHDHGDGGQGAEAPSAAAIPRLVSEGSDVELVAVAKDHTLTIYLDRIATNEPVDGATIELNGEGIPSAKAKALGDGVYEIEADWLHEPGAKALTFTVMAEGIADLLAGRLVVAEAAVEPPAQPFSWSSVLQRPEFWMFAVAIGLGGFFLAFAFRPLRLPPDDTPRVAATPEPATPEAPLARHLRQAAEIVLVALVLSASVPSRGWAHEGHDHGGDGAPVQAAGNTPGKLPTGEVFLPKPTQRLLKVRTAPAATDKAQPGSELVGTVIVDPAYEGRVQAPMEGQIELAGGGISFVGEKVAAGDVLALLAPAMPVFDRGSLQQLTAEVEGKLRIAEQKLARLTRISGDYIPQREIDDTKTEIESLREQKRVLEPKAAERLELKAPVSGIISVANVRAGQVVGARDTLFEIVDPKRLWIEAIGMMGADDGAVSSATAIDGQGHTIPLAYIGRAPTLRQQSLPMLFRVEDPHASLAIGATVRVLVQKGTPVEGIIVQDGAVVRSTNGLPQVWIKMAPETFEPRAVRTSPLDGGSVLVTDGLAKGDRVVVQGAELINQIR